MRLCLTACILAAWTHLPLPGGAVTGKLMDAAMAEHMSFLTMAPPKARRLSTYALPFCPKLFSCNV